MTQEEGGQPDPWQTDDIGGDQSRAPNGKTQRMTLANERAVKAVQLRHAESWTFARIGEELGITPQAAKAAYERGLPLMVPKQDADEGRRRALDNLDAWQQMMIEEHYREVVMVNFGKVIK